MKPGPTLVLLVLLASTFAAQMPAASKGSAKGAVQGRVIQEPGAQPLKKATIQLMGHGQENSTNYSAITDAEGHFEIDDVNPGRYTILAERAGFAEADKRTGPGRGKSFVLVPGQEIKDLMIRMEAAAVVVGKILSPRS